MKYRFMLKPVAAALQAAALGATLLASAPLAAQETTTAAARDYQIAGGALATVLASFAAQAGISLSFEPALAAGKTSPGLSGRVGIHEAFARLLSGTGLEAVPAVEGGYSLRALPAASADGATLLQAVKVEGAVADASPFSPAALDRRTSKGGVLFGDVDLREIPFSVNVIGEEEIMRRRSRTITDIMETDPAHTVGGYYASSVNSISNWGLIRGFASSRGFVDGIPLWNFDLGQIEMLERVEVLRGPAAFRYGFQSPGGVINEVSKRPTDTPYAALHTWYDNFGTLYGHVDVGNRLGDDKAFGYRLNAAANRGEGWAGNGNAERELAGLSTDYRISEHTLVTALLSHSRSRTDDLSWGSAWYSEDGEALPIGRDEGVEPAWAYNQGALSRALLRIDSELSDHVSLSSSLGLNRADWSYIDFWMEGLQIDGSGAAVARESDEQSSSFSHTSYLAIRFATGSIRHRFKLGYVIERNRNDWDAVYGENTPYNIIEHPPLPFPEPATTIGYQEQSEQYGGFVSDQFDIGERWHGVAGLRYSRSTYTYIEPKNDYRAPTDATNAVTPMLGLLYDFTPELGVYASAGTGVEPGLRAPLDASNPNEQLGPIKSTQYEAGLKWTLDEGRTTVDAAMFHITRSSQFYQGPGTRFDDYGEQRHIGAELTARGRFWQHLRLTAGAQYLNAELVKTDIEGGEGDHPIGVPEWQGVIDGTYDIAALPGLWVSGTMIHVGARELHAPNDDFENEAYTRYDLGLGYTFRTRSTEWASSLRIENIDDKEYFVGSAKNWGSPRTISFGFDARF